MFYHVKDLQFDVRVSGPDLRFAKMLLEQFGGPNGELSAALQYFVQAFSVHHAYPDKYDLLMDISTEEFGHLEMVGATISLLLEGVNGELKDAVQNMDLFRLMRGRSEKDQLIQAASTNSQFLVETGGGPALTNSEGQPFSGAYVSANGDLTVDLRSDIAAESRAKIVYEYLIQYTDDPHVKNTLSFLMTREIAHFQMFSAALESIQPNFPPGILQGDPRYTHAYFNASDGANVRGPWNQGSGPWPHPEKWEYVERPELLVRESDQEPGASEPTPQRDPNELAKMERELGARRSAEVKGATAAAAGHWNPPKAASRPSAKSRQARSPSVSR